MNILDLLILSVFFLSTLLGFLRGGAREIIGFGGWIRAVILSFFGAGLLSPLLANLIINGTIRWILAFFILFTLERLSTYALGILLTEIVKASHLNGLNTFIGLLLGMIRGIVLILTGTLLCLSTLIPTTNLWRQAYFPPITQAMAVKMVPLFRKKLPSLPWYNPFKPQSNFEPEFNSNNSVKSKNNTVDSLNNPIDPVDSIEKLNSMNQ